MIRFYFVVVLIVGVLACNPSRKEMVTKPKPSFEMKTFRLESTGGCSSDTIPCARYEITYPVFSNLDSVVIDSIKGAINLALDGSDPGKAGRSFEMTGKEFIADYEQFKNEFPESVMGWHFEGTVEVDSLSTSILCLTTSTDYFTGGAHGGHGTYFVNIDPATGSKIKLSDRFKPGFEEPLREAGEKIFKATYLRDSLSEAAQSYQFEEGTFTLNSNYTFTGSGIKFLYNIYEIAPYSAGVQEIVIPYEDIKLWLTE